MSKPTHLTVAELVQRWRGIVSARTIYSWTQHPHRGPQRADDMRPLVAFNVETIEQFEATNPRLRLALAKRGAQ